MNTIVRHRLSGVVRTGWLLAPLAAMLALVSAAVVEIERRQAHGQGSPPAVSWVLFALAGAALALSGGEPARRSLAPTAPCGELLRTRRPWPAVTMFVAAIVFSVASVPLFIRLNGSVSAHEAGWAANNASWLLYLGSLTCFTAGALLCRNRRGGGGADSGPGWPVSLPRRVELAVVSALTVLALALRLPALGSIPHGLWFDEAQNAIVAHGLLSPGALHPVFVGDFTQMGSLYFYLLGAIREILGSSIWAIRVLPGLAGSLTVPLLYLLASRLFGWRVGLAAGGFLAISSWSITFSRFGLASMIAVALDTAVFLCVVLGLRSGRLGWYAAGGILLGLDLQGYYIARLVPIVLILVLAHMAFGYRQEVWRLRSGIAVFAAASMLAFLPVGLFAIQRTADYEARTTTVSIFSELGRGGDPHALRDSLHKHLLMFNYRGDDNGRHNVPGAPMLDWLTAAFFFSGLALCLLRVWRWEYFLVVVWFAAMLSGGVLSLLFEAPQAHRTLENAVVTALLAGIFLGEGWSALTRAPLRRPLAATVGAAAALAAVGGAAAMNLEKYFGRQANDPRVWSDMGAGKLDAARLVRRYSPADEVWTSDVLIGQPAVQLVAPGRAPVPWSGLGDFPFSGSMRRPILLVLDPDRAAELALLASTYPHARFRVYRAPGGTPLLYAVFVPATDVSATHGVLALAPGGESRRLSTFRSASSRSLGMHLVATLKVSALRRRRFVWRGSSASRVAVDGLPFGPHESRRLAIGLHRLEVGARGAGELLSATGTSKLKPLSRSRLFDPRRVWPRGLLGTYRPGATFQGPAQYVRIDPLIAIQFHRPPIPPPFTVDWHGELYAPAAGRYVLGIEQVDTARLFVEGRLLIENARTGLLEEASIRLPRGWHRVRIQYQGLTQFPSVGLRWTPPGRLTSSVPADYVRPSVPRGPLRPPRPALAGSDGEIDRGRLVDARGG